MNNQANPSKLPLSTRLTIVSVAVIAGVVLGCGISWYFSTPRGTPIDLGGRTYYLTGAFATDGAWFDAEKLRDYGIEEDYVTFFQDVVQVYHDDQTYKYPYEAQVYATEDGAITDIVMEGMAYETMRISEVDILYLALENGITMQYITDKETAKRATSPQMSADDVTLGQENALEQAENYLRTMPFSRTGLAQQLQYEGYTTDESFYAVDHCGADWNVQADAKAEQYLELMAFSRQGLIDQLQHDGFTEEQAVYGVSQNGY